MIAEFITKSDLTEFKKELLSEIKAFISPTDQPRKSWLKSNEVRQILGCSHGTLQNLRINGKLLPTKVLGTYYYESEQVMSLLKSTI